MKLATWLLLAHLNRRGCYLVATEAVVETSDGETYVILIGYWRAI